MKAKVMPIRKRVTKLRLTIREWESKVRPVNRKIVARPMK